MTKTYDIQMDVSGSDFETNPEPYLLADGQPVREENELMLWDGKMYDGSQGGCTNCDVPHEVRISAFDWNDPDATYYIFSDKRNSCCSGMWVSARQLIRSVPLTPPTPSMSKSKALLDRLGKQDLTYAQILTFAEDVYRATVKEARDAAVQNEVPSGVCSGCYSTVTWRGSKWQHEDEASTCEPAAILLVKP